MKLAPVVFALAVLALPAFSQDNKNPVTTVVKDMLTRQRYSICTKPAPAAGGPAFRVLCEGWGFFQRPSE
jgi:hypothetical protein